MEPTDSKQDNASLSSSGTLRDAEGCNLKSPVSLASLTLKGEGRRDAGRFDVLIFDVDGVPSPEPRPRFDSRSMRTYVPTTAHWWKRAIRAAAKRALVGDGVFVATPRPSPAAFGVEMVFRMPRPKSHYGTGRNAGVVKARAPAHPTGKPDLDNLVKAALDALGEWDGGVALVWCDDAQVVDTRNLRKRYVRGGETPGVAIAIWAC